METILINESTFYHVKDANSIKEFIGQKARGLLEIPIEWTLPFVCISNEVFKKYCRLSVSVDKEHFIDSLSENIFHACSFLNIESEDMIIIRSSAGNEDINDRGRYKSKESDYGVDEIKQSIELLIEDAKQKTDDMAFVIQKYCKGCLKGHLSNEFRLSQDIRDWFYEYSINNIVLNDGIAIRPWRTGIDNLKISKLTCNSEEDIKVNLTKIAMYYTNKKERKHFEFVLYNSQIIIVQADDDIIDFDDDINPMSIDLDVNRFIGFDKLTTLKKVTGEYYIYDKVRNIDVYRKAKLAIPSIYALSFKEIDCIKEGNISESLRNDLQLITKNNSIVIRTDILSEDRKEKEMLPRTETIKSYEEVLLWLKETGKNVLQQYKSAVFLFHAFIPSRAAAFVYATPNGRMVTIESLWGIPEGLYYNQHDVFHVDTAFSNIDIITENEVTIVWKKIGYKEYIIVPDENGRWKRTRVKSSLRYHQSIQDETIKRIAIDSRKIAKIDGRNVSIMWFVGVNKEYYGSDNIPWFHCEHVKDDHTSTNMRKKYFSDSVVEIKNEEDLERFENDSSIMEIFINPVEDALLRDSRLLQNIGSIANKRKAVICIFGSKLAHPYYQLIRTGASIITYDENLDNFSSSKYYYKLVRDKIAEKITNNGEQISCISLSKRPYFRALMEKTIEESKEIIQAIRNNDDSNLIEELGDEYELLSTIKENCIEMQDGELIFDDVYVQLDKKKEIIYEDVIEITELINRDPVKVTNGDFSITYSSFATDFQIELLYGDTEETKSYDLLESKDNKYSIGKDLLNMAFLLTSENSAIKISTIVQKMLNSIAEFLKHTDGIQDSDFMDMITNKRIKKGGFKKGLLLIKSTLSYNKREDEQLCLFDDSNQNNEFIIHDSIPYRRIKNIEYLNRKEPLLLVRLSLPISFNHYQTEIGGSKVERYFKNGSTLYFDMCRENGIIRIKIYKCRELFDQMKLRI